MSDISPLPIRYLIPRGDEADLEMMDDEIFMDLQDGTGTQFLAETCYGIAVLDCLRIGKDAYILKVRPDMRGMLFSQLKAWYRMCRVYRLTGRPESRLLLTDKIFVQFTTGSTPDQRRLTLGRYMPGAADLDGMEDGVYVLTGKFAEDPIFVVKALELELAVRQAAPVVVALPLPMEEDASVDLIEAEGI